MLTVEISGTLWQDGRTDPETGISMVTVWRLASCLKDLKKPTKPRLLYGDQ